jgi:hypothetical protein
MSGGKPALSTLGLAPLGPGWAKAAVDGWNKYFADWRAVTNAWIDSRLVTLEVRIGFPLLACLSALEFLWRGSQLAIQARQSLDACCGEPSTNFIRTHQHRWAAAKVESLGARRRIQKNITSEHDPALIQAATAQIQLEEQILNKVEACWTNQFLALTLADPLRQEKIFQHVEAIFAEYYKSALHRKVVNAKMDLDHKIDVDFVISSILSTKYPQLTQEMKAAFNKALDKAKVQTPDVNAAASAAAPAPSATSGHKMGGLDWKSGGDTVNTMLSAASPLRTDVRVACSTFTRRPLFTPFRISTLF